MTRAYLAFTEKGLALAQKLASALPGTVDRCGSGIFQDGDAFYVVRIQVGQTHFPVAGGRTETRYAVDDK